MGRTARFAPKNNAKQQIFARFARFARLALTLFRPFVHRRCSARLLFAPPAGAESGSGLRVPDGRVAQICRRAGSPDLRGHGSRGRSPHRSTRNPKLKLGTQTAADGSRGRSPHRSTNLVKASQTLSNRSTPLGPQNQPSADTLVGTARRAERRNGR